MVLREDYFVNEIQLCKHVVKTISVLKLEIIRVTIFLCFVRLEVLQEQIVISNHFTKENFLVFDHFARIFYHKSSFFGHLLVSSLPGPPDIEDCFREVLVVGIVMMVTLFLVLRFEESLESAQGLDASFDLYNFLVFVDLLQTVKKIFVHHGVEASFWVFCWLCFGNYALKGWIGFKLQRCSGRSLRIRGRARVQIDILIHLLDRRESGIMILALILFGQHFLGFLPDQILKAKFWIRSTSFQLTQFCRDVEFHFNMTLCFGINFVLLEGDNLPTEFGSSRFEVVFVDVGVKLLFLL